MGSAEGVIESSLFETIDAIGERDELAMEQAIDQIAEMINRMQDELAATDSLEEAVEAAKGCPVFETEGRVEVRQVQNFN